MAHLLLAAAADSANAADAAVLDVTGDIEVIMRLAADDWTPASTAYPFSKWDTTIGNHGSWRFGYYTNGGQTRLALIISADGSSTTANLQPTINITPTNGVAYWLRFTLDVDNGAADADCDFYWSSTDTNDPDAVVWTQIGATVNAGSTLSIFSGNAEVVMGGFNGGAANPFIGKFYRAQIYDGIAGTLVFDADPSDPTTWTYT